MRSNFAIWTLIVGLMPSVVSCSADTEDGRPRTPGVGGTGGQGGGGEMAVVDDQRCAELALELGLEAATDRSGSALHAGVDEATAKLFPACMTTEPVEVMRDTAAAYLQLGLSSERELGGLLGLDAAASDGALDLERAKKEAFFRSIHFPERAAVWLAFSSVVLGSRVGPFPPAYTEGARTLRTSPEQFRSTCGDRYVSQVSIGGLVAIVHVVDLTAADDNAIEELKITFSDVLYRGQPDRTHPHRRYILRIGGGIPASDPHDLDESGSFALFACHGRLVEKSPVELHALLNEYWF